MSRIDSEGEENPYEIARRLKREALEKRLEAEKIDRLAHITGDGKRQQEAIDQQMSISMGPNWGKR